MKKTLFIICSVTLIASCDYVNNPVENVTPDPVDTSTGFVQRKVLLEDFTGQQCPGCPAAAIVANNLIQLHGEKMVVVAIHAGFFAIPMNSGTKFRTELRTIPGEDYRTVFNISTFPNGLINRRDFNINTNSQVIDDGDWPQAVGEELAKPAVAKIEISNNYNSSSRNLICNVKSTFLYDTLSQNSYNLIVLVTQDSILTDQKSGTQTITNYVQQHVLRTSLTPTWGVLISPVTKNTPITKSYNYTLPSTYPISGGISSTSCEPKNCHVVAFLYNNATKEVIQVEEKHVIP